MGFISRRLSAPLLGSVAAAASLAMLATNAHAVTLNGAWAPFTRCPVDSAAMLATDGINTNSVCVANDSTSGSIKIGKMQLIKLGPIQIGNAPVTAGRSNLQIGAVEMTGNLTDIDGTVSPPGGAVLSDPAEVPGGLLGLICSGYDPVITPLCNLITNNDLNRVTATLVSAGAPSDLNLIAATRVGLPILTLPVKIKLNHFLLGNNCFIGSDSNPILLHPRNSQIAEAYASTYDLDGNENIDSGVLYSAAVKSTQLDDTFSVPAASGCGTIPFVIDAVLNLKQGLPAASGVNRLELKDVSGATIFATAPDGTVPGINFMNGWNSAIISP
ncbi:hypothetical protein [Solimonas variicoloris]|uniref:hypothetical protein n=1 Tax=Solimonas variicoloris TaxID=254408 RepID=UPI0012B6353E|nr:hypothetical protein [Solimonas variicoloris]